MAITRVSQSTVKEGLERANNFLAGFAPLGMEYDSLQSTTVGAGGLATINFTSIPQTYQHLQFRCFFANSSVTIDDSRWRWNGDTTVANYYTLHQLRGDGASAVGGAFNPGVAFSYLGFYSDSTTHFTALVVDVLDYTSTTKNKVMRSFGGYDKNGSGYVFLRSSLWMNLAALSSVSITPMAGTFVQFSSFALYGIKAPAV